MMKKILFTTAIALSLLVCIFLFTRMSLIGYKNDFYFFVLTIVLNLLSFWLLYRNNLIRLKAYLNLLIGLVQFAGVIFLSINRYFKSRHGLPAKR
jgi:hypothetical protein